MIGGERVDPRGKAIDERIAVGAGRMPSDCLYDAEQVLGPMVDLLQQPLDLLLRPLPLGDVMRDLGDADDVAGVVEDWREGDGDLDRATVLADTHRFVVLDPLAAADACQKSV